MNALNIIIPAALSFFATNAPKIRAVSRRGEDLAVASAMRRVFFVAGFTLRRARLQDIVGTLFHLVVDPSQVFSEHADADQLHAADKKLQSDQRGESYLRN